MSTLLSVIQDAAVELSLVVPLQVIGNTTNDNTAAKLLRHLNKTIQATVKRDDWVNLRREYTFSTAAATESYVLPADFLRFVPETLWNRTRRFKPFEAVTPAEWQAYKAAVAGMAFQSVRVRGVGTASPSLFIAPIPGGIETLAFEYITNTVGLNGVNELAAFDDDTNTLLLDAELLTLGIVWRYRKAVGRDYAEEFREFELCRMDLLKQDGGRRTLDMNDEAEFYPPKARVPETYSV
jgi:hypothetical protein